MSIGTRPSTSSTTAGNSPWVPLTETPRGCPVVSGRAVVIDTGQGGRIDVYGRVIEAGDTVDQLVLGLVGDRVSFNHAESIVYGQGDLGVHPVPDPAQTDTLDAADSWRVTHRCLGGINQIGVDRIHQPGVDVPYRATQDTQDRHRDEQTDNGVGQRETGHNPDRPDHHR